MHKQTIDAESREVRITRMLDASPARVFELWTRAEHVAEWWGPRDEEGRAFTVPHCELDARQGGRWRICMRAPNGTDYWHQGVFREFAPPHRLVLSHAWEEEGGLGAETVITVTLEPVGARTRMTFTQGVFATAESASGHAQGWEECFDHLEAYARNV